jgi:hypothetical protein
MARFKFSEMACVISAWMDTDDMDVYRNVKTERDGAPSFTQTVQVLKNAPCHITFARADAANPASDTQPVEAVAAIHCGRDADIRNGDFVTARKLDEAGRALSVYEGVIGKPNVSAARQSARFDVRG